LHLPQTRMGQCFGSQAGNAAKADKYIVAEPVVSDAEPVKRGGGGGG